MNNTPNESMSEDKAPESAPSHPKKKPVSLKLWILGTLLLAVLVVLLLKTYTVTLYPKGENELVLRKTHLIKPNKYMPLKWWYDASLKEYGWCVRTLDPNGAEIWHLVMRKDKEVIVQEHADWWKFEFLEKQDF